jgi:betaine-aldehyde dehydrogenase
MTRLKEGGFKQSGVGRLKGVSAMEDFLDCKTIVHEIDI